jgi:flagellar basal-body rod modification protein FlgD
MADAISGIASPQSNYEKYKDMFTDKHDLVTMDNFYSLLIAEMQNQDPLEPTSNTEFISQMASFTALQAQQDTFETQQMSYANSLIGKTVTVSKGDGEVETGVVSYVKGGETPMINVNGTNYKLSAVSQVHDNGTQQSSSIGDYGAFASSILGKNAVVQSIDENGAAYYDEGTVSSLEIENGNVRVVVNGYAYNATDVLRVTQPVQEEQSIQNTSSVPDNVEPVSQQTADTSGSSTQTAQNTVTAEQTVQTRSTAAVQTDEDDIADAAENDSSDDDRRIYELFE